MPIGANRQADRTISAHTSILVRYGIGLLHQVHLESHVELDIVSIPRYGDNGQQVHKRLTAPTIVDK